MTDELKSSVVERLCKLVSKHGAEHLSFQCEVCREIIKLKEELSK